MLGTSTHRELFISGINFFLFSLWTLQTRANISLKIGIFGFGFSMDFQWFQEIMNFLWLANPKIPIFKGMFARVWRVQSEKRKNLIPEMKSSRWVDVRPDFKLRSARVETVKKRLPLVRITQRPRERPLHRVDNPRVFGQHWGHGPVCQPVFSATVARPRRRIAPLPC